MLDSRLEQAIKQSDRKVVAELADLGIPLNKRNPDGLAPVHLAVTIGKNKRILELLLKAGANVNSESREGLTALQYALNSSNLELARTLIESGADVNTRSSTKGSTALHVAIDLKDEAAMEFLLARGPDKSVKNNLDASPLQWALNNDKMYMAKILITCGADVNSRSVSTGKTTLHIAVDNNDKAMVEYLINQGVDVKVSCDLGRTALHRALDPEIAKMIVDAGIDVNKRDNHGETALHKSVINKKHKVTSFLLSRGADFNITNNFGHRPLRLALDLGCLNTVKALIKAGADVHSMGVENQKTAMHLSAERRDKKFMKHLLTLVSYVDVEDAGYDTPLDCALYKNNLEIGKLLIDSGACVNRTNKMGQSLLHISAQKKQSKVCELLLSNGARVHATHKYAYDTPLHYACWFVSAGLVNHFKMTVKTLLRHAANASEPDIAGIVPVLGLFTSMGFISPVEAEAEKVLRFILEQTDAGKINLRGRPGRLKNTAVLDKAWRVFMKHVAVVGALNLPMHPSLAEFFSDQDMFEDFYDRCKRELEEAKRVEIVSEVSFFKVLTERKKKLKYLVENEELVMDFRRSDYKERFPI